MPFCPFSFWVPLLKPKSRKKGTLIIEGLLGDLGVEFKEAFEYTASMVFVAAGGLKLVTAGNAVTI